MTTQPQTYLTPTSKALVLDPSFVFGWAILQNNSLIDFGCLKKGKDDLYTFSKNFTNLIANLQLKHQLDFVITEIPVGSKSYNAAKALAFCNGMVLSTLSRYNTPITLLEPKDAKKLVSGRANLDKSEVIDIIKKTHASIFDRIKDKPGYIQETICDCVLLYMAALGQTYGHQV